MVNRLTIIAKKIVQLESFAIEESSFDSFSSRDTAPSSVGGRRLCRGRLTPLGADVVLDLKLILTREGLPSTIRQV